MGRGAAKLLARRQQVPEQLSDADDLEAFSVHSVGDPEADRSCSQSGWARFTAANLVGFAAARPISVRSRLLLSCPCLDRPGPASGESLHCSDPVSPLSSAHGRPIETRLFSLALFPSGCKGRWKWNRAR